MENQGIFLFPPKAREKSHVLIHIQTENCDKRLTEEIVLKMAKHVQKETGMKYLCLAGGVALNCVSNGKLLRSGLFDDIWIQPSAGDAGGAIGCALFTWYQYLENQRNANGKTDFMQGAYLGPEFNNDSIESYLKKNEYSYQKLLDEELRQRLE